MLLSESFFGFFHWLGIALFLAIILVGLRAPKAERGSPPAKKFIRLLLLIVGITVLVNFVACGVEPMGDAVVIVKIVANSSVTISRARIFGNHAYEFQDHHSESLGGSGEGTTIVNDSATAMKVTLATYGDFAQSFGSQISEKDQPVAPMTITHATTKIDFVGPNDPPTKTVSTQGNFEERYWLRW